MIIIVRVATINIYATITNVIQLLKFVKNQISSKFNYLTVKKLIATFQKKNVFWLHIKSFGKLSAMIKEITPLRAYLI